MSVEKLFKILIADRNPHVRDFLKREMTAAGYEVQLAENGREVLRWAYHANSPDVVILDPDLPDADEIAVLKKLQNRIPVLPVVIHTFLADYAQKTESFNLAVWVEKKGNSVEQLKEILFNILHDPKSDFLKKSDF